ncbi:Mov34/MPN/PAD-1 family protein [Muricauda sp. NFXS6]|uniref:Mov34/MPN/PAD-1 family protein n=1 Tax=Allomuricauda sp. NFXS6 TaxID=2819094 RepID=UPI0032DE9F4D
MIISLGDTYLKILPKAFHKMQDYIQDNNSKEEAGGIMLGYYIDANNFIIIEVTLPDQQDKQSRYGFWRTSIIHQRFLNKLFKKSKGKSIYLGEWHTHPEDIPTPSHLDRKSIVEQIRKSKLNSDTIFTLIMARKGLHLSMVKKDGAIFDKQLKFEELSSPLD